MTKKADVYLTAHKDDIISDISEFLKIPSITCDREKTVEALDWVVKKALSMGLCAGYAVADELVIVTAGFSEWNKAGQTITKNMSDLKRMMDQSGKETLGILAHVDVVPALGDWKHPPFAGHVEQGSICGRGILDDKGPLVLCLHGMKALSLAAMKTGYLRQVIMIVGSREEETWSDIAAFNAFGIRPDFGFTPDGEFPITNAEKGYVDIKILAKKGIEDNNTLLEGGTATNIIPDYAGAKIIDSKTGVTDLFEAKGEAAHSSRPEKGINAIYLLSEQLKDMGPVGAAGDLLGFIHECCQDSSGEGLGIASGEVNIGEDFFHHNVCAPTMLETTAQGFELIINVRTAFGYTGEFILERISEAAKVHHLSAELLESMSALIVPRDKPFLKTLGEVYQDMTGETHLYDLAHGSSYAKAMPNTVSFGPIFPGDLDNCHEVDESASIEQLFKAAGIYFEAIKRLCL